MHSLTFLRSASNDKRYASSCSRFTISLASRSSCEGTVGLLFQQTRQIAGIVYVNISPTKPVVAEHIQAISCNRGTRQASMEPFDVRSSIV